jgi:UDP-N-acetylmuramoyl-tripeptide--D-alanyl-D-alanine ligase
MLNDIYNRFLSSGGVSTDTRTILPGNLFFALSGSTYNGNVFALEAIEKGANAAVVSERQPDIPENQQFVVNDVLSTLQQLATLHRRNLKIPVVALTGSNGKTTTKELMRAVLTTRLKVLATEGNLNNHIGVPLTILRLTADHQIAVIEMGANHKKEIAALSAIAEPDAGLITNIGKAHLEGFGGIQGVLAGKTELFQYLKSEHKSIIFNDADPYLQSVKSEYKPALTYASEKSDITGTGKLVGHQLQVEWQYQGNPRVVQTNLTGTYNLQNVLAAIATGIFFDIPPDDICNGIESYVPTNSRSQIITKGTCKVILDAYNANPTSTRAALENLTKFEGKKYFLLGDMLELGEESAAEHQMIIDYARELGLQGIFVGPHYASCNSLEYYAFKHKEEAASVMNVLGISQCTILLKGSRGMKMESFLDLIS